MALPVVAGSEVSTPGSAVKVDAGPLRSAALAKGELGAAIGEDVGGLFADVSQKIQANRNARTVFQADLAMRKTKDNFTSNLAKMPDETTWLPAYKQQVDQTREAVMGGTNVGPEVRRVLEQKFASWEQATTSEIKTAALLKGAKETREDAIADATYAAHQGHLEDANNILNAAVAHYAMTRADAHKLWIRFPGMAAQAQADTAIATNPIQAPELIKRFEKTLDPRVYLGLQAHANEAKNRAQAANTNDLAGQMDQSPDGTIDPKLLTEKVKAGEITQRAADGLVARMQKTYAATSKDAFNNYMLDADDHQWADDKKREETTRTMKDQGAELPSGLRKRLYEHIDKLASDAKKEGEREEKPVARDILERGKKDYAQGLFRPAKESDVLEEVPHWYKADETKVVGKTTKQPTPDSGWEVLADDKERATARLNYARWQDKMRGFFKDNPEATSEQAEGFSQKAMGGLTEDQAKAALTPAAKTVRVRSKDGKPGTIPIANLQKALEAGYTEVK